MRITEVEVITLFAPEAEVVKSTCIIRLHTDEGVEGIGQVEMPSLIVQALVKTREWEHYWSPGLEQVLVGEDPLQTERLWQKMYASMWLYGRRGAGIAALTGIDIALWDIRGKVLGKPVYQLLSGSFGVARDEPETIGPRLMVKPYATVYPSGTTPEEVRKNMSLAISSGFHAVKLEEYKGGFGRKDAKYDAMLVEAAREAIGRENDLMVDAQYIWQDYTRALETIRAMEPYDIYFVEAPLPPDNLGAYARLADSVSTRIACGDGGFTTRYEFLDLMEKGRVDVVQPSMVRSGGITETLRIASMAHERGVLCIPHSYAWKVGVAAEMHLAAVVPNMPYIEMPSPYPYSPLVSELLTPDPMPKNGYLEVPQGPGLGFRLDERTVSKYRVDPF